MYFHLIAGFMLLLGGAEFLVRGAVAVARRLGVSPLIIGMTVVALGTSAPELVVSLEAALNGSAGLALGNVVGSNIANVLLILGASGLVAPIVIKPRLYLRDGAVLAIGSVLFAILCWQGVIGLIPGVLLLTVFLAFLGYSFWRESHDDGPESDAHIQEVEDIQGLPRSAWVSTLILAAGMGSVIYGADILIEGAVSLARVAGVSEEVIGLTLIAFGTSLPELAASGVAALRGHAEVALGNIIGSNLFNILAVVGTVAVVTPLAVPDQITSFDLWVMLAATALLIALLLAGRNLGRGGAAAFLALYAAYIAVQAYGVSGIVPTMG